MLDQRAILPVFEPSCQPNEREDDTDCEHRTDVHRAQLSRRIGLVATAPRKLRAKVRHMIPSVIFVNGAFGVGKTTVARALQSRLAGSRIYDPEYVGFVLQRLPRWIPLRGRGTDDFQDLAMWRRSVSIGIRLRRSFARGPVLVPMAFSNLQHLDEVLGRVRTFEPCVRVFCLTASTATIRARLAGRGEAFESEGGQWILHKVDECVAAHADPRFGENIDTEQQSIEEAAHDILVRLRAPATS